MPILRVSLVMILMIVLVACNQQESTEENSNNDQGNESPEGGSGIIAGKLDSTLQVEENQVVFKIKNQTEQVKELTIKGEKTYQYIITNEDGQTVFRKSVTKDDDEQITLKQAEEVTYEFDLPDNLTKGTYTVTAILQTKPPIEAKTSFTLGN